MIPVVIAFTPNYFIPAATLVHSVLRCSRDNFEFICLASERIPSEQIRILEKIANGRASFRFPEITDFPDGVYIDPRYSIAAEYRLLLPEMEPGYEKVIYVDCDIIVNNDLGDLFRNINLGDNLLAAVYEAPIENQAGRWEALGCDSGKYFNSGFLIMNLEQMRREGTSSKLFDALKTDYLEFPDQDALNMVCKGRVLPLPPVYNSIRTFFLPQYKEDFLKQYSEKDWNDVQEHGTIHYTGGKPWNLVTVKFDRWWKEYDKLPEEAKRQWTPGRKLLILAALYKCEICRWMMDGVRDAVRKIRYRI